MRRAVLSLAIIITALGPQSALAQRVAEHRGFWISFGPGYGNTFSEPFADDDRSNGLAFFVRLGGSPSQQWLVGADLVAWDVAEGVVRGQTGVAVRHYPSTKGGAFLRGTLGLAWREVSFSSLVDFGMGPELVSFDLTDSGVGLGLGLGYDLQLSRNFFLTPSVDLYGQSLHGDWVPAVLFVLGATWH